MGAHISQMREIGTSRHVVPKVHDGKSVPFALGDYVICGKRDGSLSSGLVTPLHFESEPFGPRTFNQLLWAVSGRPDHCRATDVVAFAVLKSAPVASQ